MTTRSTLRSGFLPSIVKLPPVARARRSSAARSGAADRSSWMPWIPNAWTTVPAATAERATSSSRAAVAGSNPPENTAITLRPGEVCSPASTAWRLSRNPAAGAAPSSGAWRSAMASAGGRSAPTAWPGSPVVRVGSAACDWEGAATGAPGCAACPVTIRSASRTSGLTVVSVEAAVARNRDANDSDAIVEAQAIDQGRSGLEHDALGAALQRRLIDHENDVPGRLGGEIERLRCGSTAAGRHRPTSRGPG